MAMHVFTLRSRSQMLPLLLAVSDDVYLQRYLYPALLKEAGKSRVAPSVTLTLALAIQDCIKDMPEETAGEILLLAPGLIDAMVADSTAAAEIKCTFEACTLAVSRHL